MKFTCNKMEAEFTELDLHALKKFMANELDTSGKEYSLYIKPKGARKYRKIGTAKNIKFKYLTIETEVEI